MTVLRKILLSACVLALFLGAAPAALGDWFQGDDYKMHYPQEPDPYGWDICVNCQWVADDFQCSEDGPVDDIHFWISWLDDMEGWDMIQSWDISIWSDAIGGPGMCQMQPGTRLWTWDGVADVNTIWYGQGQEGWHCPSAFWSVPNNHVNYYQINITNIADPFIQEAGTVYWLVIKVWLMTEPPPVPGWKTTREIASPWRCRALWSLDPDMGQPWDLVDTGSPMGIGPVYHDMAFVITSTPVSEELEYCDAPEGSTAVAYPSTGVTGAFPTCVTSGPATWVQHTNFGAWLGPGFDFETDGDAGLCPPPGCFPTYDDDECYADGDAGLLFPEPYTIDPLLNVVPCPLAPTGTPLGIVCQQAVWGQDIDIEVHNHMPNDSNGYVNVMLDWVQDGDWGDTAWCGAVAVPEHVLQNFRIPNPFDGPISALMPFGASFQIGPNPGYVWARVSITEVRVPVPWDGSGAFEDGESEGYLIRVDGLDFGDAPDPCYPTLLANDGARHVIGGPYFCDAAGGDSPDSEPDGQPDATATGDDLDADGDDEDGVVVPLLFHLLPRDISLDVCGGGGWVQIWVDFNRDEDWDDAGEQVHNAFLGDGPHTITVTTPAGSAVGTTFVRCRISTAGGLLPTGQADDGEVEDHETRLIAVDYGDAPDPCYPTLVTSNGARHSIVSGAPWLGPNDDGPDADGDGQPDPAALGDDSDAQGDDEDGVTIPPLTIGVPTDISVEVSGGGGWVYGWIDFNADGDWDDAGEMVTSGNLPDGVNVISVTAPAGSAIGTSFARFRIISTAIAAPTPRNWWNDGEVEDLEVEIRALELKPPVPHLKWSQPPIEWDPTLIIPLYCGWDEESWTNDPCNWWLAVADDFRCLGTMPITSVHWWASHLGWDEDVPPDPGPSAWRIGFWSNVPANATADPPWSHPEKLLWQVEVAANRVQVDYVGKDMFPDMPLETCFQYYVELDGPEWFWQSHYELETRDNVFWISIVAIYPSGTDPVYEWGWKTRPWSWMDDAVTFEHFGRFEPGIVLDPALITPIENPLTQKSMDVAFELDTDPCYIKWEQPFTGIRHWPHYEDELSMGTWEPVTIYKWWQGPDLTMGLDVDMTDDLAGTQPAQILADDFECISSEPITDVHVWCSWLHDQVLDPMNVMFTLSIHDDIPAGVVAPWSMPGDVRWWRDFQPGEFMAWPYATDLLEGWWSPCTGYYDPDGDTVCWEYDFYIDPGEAFVQEGSPDDRIVYWLDVQAQPYDEIERIGWKTSNEPWNDDGVWAIGNEPYVGAWQELLRPMSPESLDLAFAITTEQEEFFLHSLVADDWPCDNNKPITAVVWWGSYIGYTYEACRAQLAAPPVRPDYFWLAIWDDVPAVVGEPTSYSHPNSVVWEYATRDYDEVLVGYDKHPHGEPNEPVFRYSVRVPKENWFFQREPNSVYWLSVVAVYDQNWPNYDWGWTNHEQVYNDDAVTGYLDASGVWSWTELFDQTGESEDMSFILFTEPDCLSVAAPEYADWILWGRPKCWCYPRQCRGDIDGKQTGPFHVAIPDLGLFKPCFNRMVLPPGCICADLDHMQTGPFRVAIPDLAIFKTYFNQFFVPQCDQLPIYTGPYNFWTSP